VVLSFFEPGIADTNLCEAQFLSPLPDFVNKIAQIMFVCYGFIGLGGIPVIIMHA
jgi:hypothetical protein